MACPNKNNSDYKELIQEFGEGNALAAWVLNGEKTPTIEQAAKLLNSPVVSSQLKIVKALLDPKATILFNKFYKSDPDKFYKELLNIGATKDQIELIKDIKASSINDLLTSLLANYSYTVEINTAKENDHNLIVQRGNQSFPAFMDDTDHYINTSHYSNLTVPGGSNYSENEIATPGITPSIKGHAQFSTDKGIGWGRWDEPISYNTIDEVVNHLKQSGRLKIIC